MLSANTIKDDLKTVFKGELLDDRVTLETYSKDASIFDIKPQLVATPIDSSDIQSLIKYVNSHPGQNLSITPRSAGTCMSGGAIGESIILDMKRHFNKVLEIGDDFSVTQPGVFYKDFEKKTLEKDLLLPCYTASREINTVGGMAANNSAGEKTLTYGQTKDWILQLKVIFSDGNEYVLSPLDKSKLDKKLAQNDFEGKIYNQLFNLLDENYEMIQKARPDVSKNAAGYLLWDAWDKNTFDISKLIVGSQGTLGIITEIKFKLIRPNKHSKLLVIFLHNIEELETVVNKVLEFKPESFESYDDQTLKVAMRFLPEVLKVFKPSSLISLIFSFLPEMWMSFSGGMPKLVLLAEFTGNSIEEVDQKCLNAKLGIKQFKLKNRITNSEEETRKYWILRRESFNLLRHHAKHMRTAPFIDDIVIKPEYLPQFLPKLELILKDYEKDIIYTMAGHIGNGNFHIIPLMDFTKERTKQLIPEISKRVYDLVFEYHGSMDGEHNDGLVRGPYLPQMFGEDVYQLFKDVKKIFDPNNIFNPHKKVDATFEYSLNHLSKS